MLLHERYLMPDVGIDPIIIIIIKTLFIEA